MELLIFLLICFTKAELQPKAKSNHKRNSKLLDITTTHNDTTITYHGTGTIDVVTAQLAFGYKIIVIEEGITGIANEAFYQASLPLPADTNFFQYEKVYVPKSLVSIGDYAFSSVDSKLTTFLFPQFNGTRVESEFEKFYALRSIGKGAFMNCKKLTNANIPSTYTKIEDFTFMGVPITGTSINSKVESIGIGAFQNCNKLKSMTIPASVTTIGAYAFGNCSNLTTVTFNNAECTIGGECFKNCVNLKEITFPKSAHLSLPGAILENCASLTKCTMPTTLTDNNGVESSTFNMFTNCQKLSTVTLPTNIKELGTRMFMNTSIETLYLPKTVNKIGADALKDCTKLKYVNVSCTDPVTLSLNIFENTPNLELLSVHGDLAVQMGEDMFGGKKFCYYGMTNPVGSKLSLDPTKTTVYVTKAFQKKYDKFGSLNATSIDQFNGYDYKVMSGTVCSFPGEPGLPIETEPFSNSNAFSPSELLPSSSVDETSQPNESSDLLTTEEPSSSDAGAVDNNDNNKKKKKLSTGAIIGIVLGCLAFLALLLLLIICCCKKRRHNHIETRDDHRESSIGLKKTPSKKDYESVDNLKDQQPEKLMV